MTDAPNTLPPAQANTAAQEDLAFLRALVQSGDGMQKTIGQTYLAGGLCYGAQLLLSGLDGQGFWPPTPAISVAIAAAPSLVFGVLMAWIIWRGRREAPPAGAQRAIAKVFGTLGLTNLALIVVIGAVAWREGSITTWLIYPCCVFVLQGAAWLIAFNLRRRAWMAVVGAGWIVSAAIMAIFIEAMPVFIVTAGVGLMLFMALPGWLIMRGAKIVAG